MKNSPVIAVDPIKVRVQKTQGRFKRIRNPQGRDGGEGEFFLLIDITAVQEDLYIPTSIASGKKPTGFVYQIEGTAEGTIVTTHISCKGEGVTQVTLGTLLYTKIPKGKKATFRILIEVQGQAENDYKIVMNRINYKRDLSVVRYEKYVPDIRTGTLKFH